MENRKWWKEAVVYEVYPRSFQDSNGDGMGDIRGVISRLPYIKELGANAIWLCPCYKSPWSDNGYDIADYYQVAPEFGTNEELYELIEKAKKHDIKILLDLVMNHTSDEHTWFQEALQNPDSKYRDYYFFEKGVNGQAPNNWRSYFGGSAWEPVPGEDNMFYLHAFSKKMPDLNWDNPSMREELYTMINWWLDKGIGGFRIDAILNIKKNMIYGTVEPDGDDGLAAIDKYIINQPGIGALLSELKSRTFANYDIMTVAEAAVPDDQVAEFIGPDGYFNMSFDFRAADIDIPDSGEWFKPTNWTVNQLRDIFLTVQTQVQNAGWGAVYLENHDQNRSVNKYFSGSAVNDVTKKMLGTILLGFRGTPVIYQGEEIGMENIELASIDQYSDIQTYHQYQDGIQAGLDSEYVYKMVTHRSRDNSRTPMQWDQGKNAGFTDGTPWLPVNDNFADINVECERNNKDSVYAYYKSLVALRTDSQYKNVLVYGKVAPLFDNIDYIIAYKRQLDNQELQIIANFQEDEVYLELDAEKFRVLQSNYEKVDLVKEKLHLQPYQAVLLANF